MEKFVFQFLAQKPNKDGPVQLCNGREGTPYVGGLSEKPFLGSHVVRLTIGNSSNTHTKEKTRRFGLCFRSSRTAAEETTDVVVHPKKSAYVPTHAASDFGSLPMPTTYRQSQAYEWRHGYPGRRQSDATAAATISGQSSPRSSPSMRSGTSDWSAPPTRSSGRQNCSSTVSDRCSAHSKSKSSEAAQGKHKLGRWVSEYIRPPLAQDPISTERFSIQRLAF